MSDDIGRMAMTDNTDSPAGNAKKVADELAGKYIKLSLTCISLRARIAELEAALKPFAGKDTEVTPERQYYDMLVKHEDRVRARAALNGEK